MLKSLHVATGLSIVWFASRAGVAVGQRILDVAQVSSFNQVDLVCYMQTSDGRTVNLTSLCGRSTSTNTATPAAGSGAPLSPYTNLGNLDIYGGGTSAAPCFGLDDQGRPCPSSSRSLTD